MEEEKEVEKGCSVEKQEHRVMTVAHWVNCRANESLEVHAMCIICLLEFAIDREWCCSASSFLILP